MSRRRAPFRHAHYWRRNEELAAETERSFLFDLYKAEIFPINSPASGTYLEEWPSG